MNSSAPRGTLSAEQMKQVLEVSRLLAATDDLDQLLLRIAQAATTVLRCERASIFLHDAARDQPGAASRQRQCDLGGDLLEHE